MRRSSVVAVGATAVGGTAAGGTAAGGTAAGGTAAQRPAYVHPTADVSPLAHLGAGTQVWHRAHVREDAVVGAGCTLGTGVYVDAGVHLGSSVKVQNYASVFHGVTVEDGVFIGPHVCFSNDLRPRAVNPDGSPKSAADWTVTPTLVRAGASVGANATVVCGVTIGRWAMVGAGAVVTRDVPDHGLVAGNPARLLGFVCRCGARVPAGAAAPAPCSDCGSPLPAATP